MSKYTPDQAAMRSAWRFAMTGEVTPDEAADASFDRYTDVFKRRQQAVGHMAAQEAMQSTIDASIQEVQERVWAECSQWHAEQGMPVYGAGNEHNPYRAEGDGRDVTHE